MARTQESMTTKALAALLIEYGESNSVPGIVDASPYLDALAHAFGDRDARDVTAKELHAFHQRMCASPAVSPLLTLLEKKSQRWEAAYVGRAQGVVESLQWESDRPVRALVELFERPGFHPQRVLELGCGDGVNAVFMAARGCQVTAVDISHTALELAREKQRSAQVDIEFVEGDVFELDPHRESYDFVFDRGMFHHLQVFQFEDYKDFVANRLAPNGYFHLICHHVSTRPTVLFDCLFGFVGKLLGFLSGILVEPGTGFTADELHEIFSDRFRFQSMELIWDDNNRPLRFESSLLQRIA
jgi:2-polyprenyl-3-methyl-5-hydroxy-6-metoxy-1,4-benzoquinol methylase